MTNKILIALWLIVLPLKAQLQEQSLPAYIDAKTQSFAMFNDATQVLAMDNWKAAHERIPPFSTFKIVNSLIAIDTGIIDPELTKLTFNPMQYPVEKWWPKSWYEQPLTLRQAFQESAVPIFRQLAGNIGEYRMQEYLQKFNYGNRDTSSGIDSFWLNGSLNISAVEQVSFLRQIFSGTRGLPTTTLGALKKVMWTELWEGYDLYAKTGSGQIQENLAVGWYVGFLERSKNGNRIYFAAFVTGKSIEEVKKIRIEYTKAQLRKNLMTVSSVCE